MANKLLLINDVEHLGRSGDIVSVRPGYARNFLIPQGFAVTADKRALQMQARLQEERRKKAIHDRTEAEGMAAKLENAVLETTVKVDHEGHMYGSVSAQDIQHLIEKQLGLAIERRAIVLKHAFKETGVFAVPLRLKEDVQVETL
jgi:large subunit ribosomal protein L9